MRKALSGSESERAAVAARGGPVVASPRPRPVCGQAIMGRKTSTCSEKCRARKSRLARIPLPVAEAKATLEKYGEGAVREERNDCR